MNKHANIKKLMKEKETEQDEELHNFFKLDDKISGRDLLQ